MNCPNSNLALFKATTSPVAMATAVANIESARFTSIVLDVNGEQLSLRANKGSLTLAHKVELEAVQVPAPVEAAFEIDARALRGPILKRGAGKYDRDQPLELTIEEGTLTLQQGNSNLVLPIRPAVPSATPETLCALPFLEPTRDYFVRGLEVVRQVGSDRGRGLSPNIQITSSAVLSVGHSSHAAYCARNDFDGRIFVRDADGMTLQGAMRHMGSDARYSLENGQFVVTDGALSITLTDNRPGVRHEQYYSEAKQRTWRGSRAELLKQLQLAALAHNLPPQRVIVFLYCHGAGALRIETAARDSNCGKTSFGEETGSTDFFCRASVQLSSLIGAARHSVGDSIDVAINELGRVTLKSVGNGSSIHLLPAVRSPQG